MRTLVWFRGKDLRVTDHAPLTDAARAGEIIALFVLDPFFFAPKRAGELPHRMQFLLASLRELAESLKQRGSRLLLVSGKSIECIPRIAQDLAVDRVVAYRWSEPFAKKRDAIVTARLRVPFILYEGETLAAPGAIRTKSGTPYKVFTPFARAFRNAQTIDAPIRAPASLPPLPRGVAGKVRDVPLPTLKSLGLRANARLLLGGEAAAKKRLSQFLRGAGAEYSSGRDRMDLAGTSRLSQDLKFGVLSARTVWTSAMKRLDDHPRSLKAFTNELLWREFTHATLRDFPQVLERPFRDSFVGFPWRSEAESERDWRAWAEGRTGYPLVDAAARQLLGEGFVHNRARMVAASFLTKHLLIDYRRGEAHYMKYLTDGDWAQNNAGWQWCAGTGCDAQPYFRVFNPITQGARFDPDGAYVRRYVPELSRLPTKYIHAPWQAPKHVLVAAGVLLGETYPNPVVAHAYGRDRFLRTAQTFRATANDATPRVARPRTKRGK